VVSEPRGLLTNGKYKPHRHRREADVALSNSGYCCPVRSPDSTHCLAHRRLAVLPRWPPSPCRTDWSAGCRRRSCRSHRGPCCPLWVSWRRVNRGSTAETPRSYLVGKYIEHHVSCGFGQTHRAHFTLRMHAPLLVFNTMVRARMVLINAPWYSAAPADGGRSAPSDRNTGCGMSPVCCCCLNSAYCCMCTLCIVPLLTPAAEPFILANSTRSTSSLSSQDRSLTDNCR
jgi:hypothetical protein